MALNLSRLGRINRTVEDDYNPFQEGADRRRAEQLAKAEAQALEKGTLDLARAKRDDAAAIKAAADAEGVKKALSSFYGGRALSDVTPASTGTGAISLGRMPKGLATGPEFGEAPKDTTRDISRFEGLTTANLAAIDPMQAEKFRTGQRDERFGLEDRTRRIGKEDLDATTTAANTKFEQDLKNRTLRETSRHNKVGEYLTKLGITTKANNTSEGKIIPASAQTAMLENVQNAKKARKALALLSGKDVGSSKGDKKPTGFWKGLTSTLASGSALNNLDPEGVDARAAIADLGSMVIHDRSGAAVTASESPRLMPFIPSAYDKPDVAKKKVKRFIQEYNSILEDQAQQYGREAGYRESPLMRDYLAEMPRGIFDNIAEARAAGLPPGTVVIVDGEEVEMD